MRPLPPCSHLFSGLRHLVQGHSVVLDSQGILLLLEIDVAQVHSEPPTLGIILVTYQCCKENKDSVSVSVRECLEAWRVLLLQVDLYHLSERVQKENWNLKDA